GYVGNLSSPTSANLSWAAIFYAIFVCSSSGKLVGSVRLCTSPADTTRALEGFPALTTCVSSLDNIRHSVQHRIITKGPPVFSRQHRLVSDRSAKAKKEFDALLEMGIDRPSNSPWASPLHMVPKREPVDLLLVIMSIGVPLKILHEAEGHIVMLETNTGEVFRGKLLEAEDNMNCNMTDVTITYRDGQVAQMDQVYIRGSKIRFLILPDMLKNAPMFKTMLKGVAKVPGPPRGKAAAFKSKFLI
ncbi:Small nuclear ribonucleoprotein Sm D3, partial [Trichinella zimbabwensis]